LKSFIFVGIIKFKYEYSKKRTTYFSINIGCSNYSFDCLWFYLKPKYNGQLELKSIQETTTVYFDEYGIPHIYAANAKDAMVALGYVHAKIVCGKWN
jgi:acyl-homoserine lactone acylase PvdQ